MISSRRLGLVLVCLPFWLAALASDPVRCLGITAAAWATGRARKPAGRSADAVIWR